MEADYLSIVEKLAEIGEGIELALESQTRVALALADDKRAVRRQNRTVLLAIVLVAVVLLSGTLIGQRNRADEAETTALNNSRQAECRTRITSAVVALTDEADGIVRQALVDYATRGRPTGLVEKAAQVDDLNRRIQAASDLRSRSVDICAANPDYTPP